MPGGVDQTTFKKATKDSRPEREEKGMFDCGMLEEDIKNEEENK